ncbi:MAG: Hsp20/alpha crystallin family protein [Candidatus Caldarchaeales archaeon]
MSGDYFEKDIRRVIDKMARDLTRIIESTISYAKSPLELIYGEFRRPYSETYTTEDEIVVVVEMPGASKEMIDLKIGEDYVEVEGRFAEELTKQAPRYTIFKAKGYKTRIMLPRKVRGEDAKAVYRDGLLIAKIPIEKPKGITVKIE